MRMLFVVGLSLVLLKPEVVWADGGVEDAGVDAGVLVADPVVITASDPVIVPMQVDAGLPDAGVSKPSTDLGSLDSPQSLLVIAYKHIKAGDWVQAIGALVVFLIALLRLFGKKVHAAIPDSSWMDKPFWFLFDTKPGGWILNFLFVTAAGMASVYAAGESVTWELLKPILSVSLTAAALWGLVKDVWEWIQGIKAKKAETPPSAPSAGA